MLTYHGFQDTGRILYAEFLTNLSNQNFPPKNCDDKYFDECTLN